MFHIIFHRPTKLWSEITTSDFAAKVIETLVSQLILISAGLATTVVVSRILGPAGRGLYAVAVTVGMIGVQISNLGLHSSNIYFVAQDRTLLAELIKYSVLVSACIAGIGAFGLNLFFLKWPSVAPLQGKLLFLALAWIPCGLLYLLLQNLLLGIKEIRAYNIIEVINKLLTIALIGFAYYINVVSVEIVFAVSLISMMIALLWTSQTLCKRVTGHPEPESAFLKKYFNYGFKIYLAALFSFLVMRIDLIVVKQLLGAEQAGYYSVAASMADMVLMFPTVVGTILFPNLSAMINEQEKWLFTRKTVYVVGIITTFLGAIAAFLAKPAVTFLFDKAFLPAVPAFLLLIPGIVLLSVNIVYMRYFASIGMPLVAIYSPGIASALNIVLNIELLPLLGIVGASISSSICYGLMLFFSIFYVHSMHSR